MPSHSKRTNFYEPYTVGKSIYRIPQERFVAQMKFVNGYQKSCRFYTMDEARMWIDSNYDEMSELAQTGPGSLWWDMCADIILKNQIRQDFNVAPQ